MPGFIFRPVRHSLTTLSSVAYDLIRLLMLAAWSRRAFAAENHLAEPNRLYAGLQKPHNWARIACLRQSVRL